MNIAQIHAWPRTPRSAIALQKRLAVRVKLTPVRRLPRLIAGLDGAFSPDGTQFIAGVVVWDVSANRVVDSAIGQSPVRFPYVPGLLSFREIPGILAVLRRLRVEPEVLFCDGQGLAHPRRFGLACHLGIWVERPTVGVAKSLLCGEYAEPAASRGARTPLRHNGALVGVVLRTRDNVKPLFVSPGHLCDLVSAARLVLHAGRGYRLPEPARLAHQLVTRARSTIPDTGDSTTVVRPR